MSWVGTSYGYTNLVSVMDRKSMRARRRSRQGASPVVSINMRSDGGTEYLLGVLYIVHSATGWYWYCRLVMTVAIQSTIGKEKKRYHDCKTFNTVTSNLSYCKISDTMTQRLKAKDYINAQIQQYQIIQYI